MKAKSIGGKPLAWLLTAVYFASYVTRINFAAIIQEIVTDMGKRLRSPWFWWSYPSLTASDR